MDYAEQSELDWDYANPDKVDPKILRQIDHWVEILISRGDKLMFEPKSSGLNIAWKWSA